MTTAEEHSTSSDNSASKSPEADAPENAWIQHDAAVKTQHIENVGKSSPFQSPKSLKERIASVTRPKLKPTPPPIYLNEILEFIGVNPNETLSSDREPNQAAEDAHTDYFAEQQDSASGYTPVWDDVLSSNSLKGTSHGKVGLVPLHENCFEGLNYEQQASDTSNIYYPANNDNTSLMLHSWRTRSQDHGDHNTFFEGKVNNNIFYLNENDVTDVFSPFYQNYHTPGLLKEAETSEDHFSYSPHEYNAVYLYNNRERENWRLKTSFGFHEHSNPYYLSRSRSHTHSHFRSHSRSHSYLTRGGLGPPMSPLFNENVLPITKRPVVHDDSDVNEHTPLISPKEPELKFIKPLVGKRDRLKDIINSYASPIKKNDLHQDDLHQDDKGEEGLSKSQQYYNDHHFVSWESSRNIPLRTHRRYSISSTRHSQSSSSVPKSMAPSLLPSQRARSLNLLPHFALEDLSRIQNPHFTFSDPNFMNSVLLPPSAEIKRSSSDSEAKKKRSNKHNKRRKTSLKSKDFPPDLERYPELYHQDSSEVLSRELFFEVHPFEEHSPFGIQQHESKPLGSYIKSFIFVTYGVFGLIAFGFILGYFMALR